jgi:hypothetical protein
MKLYPVRSLAAALLCLGAALLPSNADAQSKEDRCAKYATRAVEQFNILTSHPQCQKDNDLRWQNNYQNHYNGCIKLPAFMSKSEEKARDLELMKCGAIDVNGHENYSQTSAPQGATPPSDSTSLLRATRRE